MADKKKNKKSSSENSSKNKPSKKTTVGKRILKVALWTFGAIFALLLLTVIFRDSLIKFGITRIGSWLTGVQITLDSFDTSLTKGTLHLKGLQVSNPPGFKQPLMVDLDELFVDVDLASLTSQEIVIEEIRVSGLDAAAEFDTGSRFNVTTLTNNLQKHFPPEETPANASAEAPAASPADDASEEKQSKPAILIREIDVKLSLAMIHDLSGVSFPLPVAYSTTDLRIEPDEESVPLIERLAMAAHKLESYCQACFNAGQLLLSAGDEALEGLNAGLNSGLESGKVVIDQSKDLLNKGKGVLDTAGSWFKIKK